MQQAVGIHPMHFAQSCAPMLQYPLYIYKFMCSVDHYQVYTPMQWGNYHHGKSCNPIAAVHLFHVRKQYLLFCKAEAAVTRNLIAEKSFKHQILS